MTAKLAVIFSFAVALIACSSRTQVMVTVDAEPQVRAAARTLRVEVFGGTRGASSVPSLNAQIYPYAVTPDGTGWPRLIALAPQDGDTTRLYRVEARAYASSSENAPVIARAQVISGYVAGKVVWIRLVLQDACIGATCDPIAGETCVDGQCVAARRDEDDLPDYAADASYPDAGASGMDGGMPDGCRTRDDCLPSDCADVSCVRGQCIYSPRDERCADGADCTLDLCARAGSTMRCVHSPMPTFCDDGVGCTEDFCAPSEPGAQSTGCVFVPNAGLCTEGDNPRCDPMDDCQYSTCTPLNCSPRNACEVSATCNGNTCVRMRACGGGPCCNGLCTDCNDSIGCTQDMCGATGCVHTPAVGSCGTAPVCRAYVCTTSQDCTLVNQPNNTPCTAGCSNGGTCQNGSCQCAGCSTGASCFDGLACTRDLCVSGMCQNPVDCAGQCDGGMGRCGTGGACVCDGCTSPLQCEDSNACTFDMCARGACSNVPVDCDAACGGVSLGCNPATGCICGGGDGGAPGCGSDPECYAAWGPCAICNFGICESRPCFDGGTFCDEGQCDAAHPGDPCWSCITGTCARMEPCLATPDGGF